MSLTAIDSQSKFIRPAITGSGGDKRNVQLRHDDFVEVHFVAAQTAIIPGSRNFVGCHCELLPPSASVAGSPGMRLSCVAPRPTKLIHGVQFDVIGPGRVGACNEIETNGIHGPF
jgi:hypothetical protein